MTENKEITVADQPKQVAEYDPTRLWNQLLPMAKEFMNSGSVPSSIKSTQQMAMVIMAGNEVGMKPIESLNSFYIVNGKLTIYGDATLRQLRRSGFGVKWEEVSMDKVTVRIIAPDKTEHLETYSKEDAVKAGLWGKAGPWTTDPKSMMRYKALSRAVKFFCPEVLNGVPLKEDVIDFTPNAVADAEITNINQPPTKAE